MSRSTPKGGLLVLVVGPSGVGKDTLIDGARARLAERTDIVFVRRDVTRPAEAGGEDHNPVTTDEFERRAAAGAYGLFWRAHGLGYGLPVAISTDLAAGRRVVANVSRAVLDEARARFPRVRIVSVTAPVERLAERLRARGRESETEIAARIARADAYRLAGADVVELSNDATPESGVAAMVKMIET